jgi:hypothetical protein
MIFISVRSIPVLFIKAITKYNFMYVYGLTQLKVVFIIMYL